MTHSSKSIFSGDIPVPPDVTNLRLTLIHCAYFSNPVPKLHNNRPLNFVIVNLHLVKYKLNNKTKWLLRYYASLFNTLHSNRIRNENK